MAGFDCKLCQQCGDAGIFSSSLRQFEGALGVLHTQLLQQTRDVFPRMFSRAQKQRHHSQMLHVLIDQCLCSAGQVRGAGVQIGTQARQSRLAGQHSLAHGFYGLAPEGVSGAVGQQDQTMCAGRRGLRGAHDYRRKTSQPKADSDKAV